MGIAVIGGLLTSLFLTLIVVPVAYDVLDALMEKIFKKKEVMREIPQQK
jgi:Cu/Ag efflux pump CusA